MLLVLLIALSALPATAKEVPDRYGDFMGVLSQVHGLNSELLSRDSATATLQNWCDAHGPGGGVRIMARRISGADKPAGRAERRDLKVGRKAMVAYRRVELVCGDKVLSEADNWYLPGRLTPEMNAALTGTQTPFGVVVKPLNFRRRTLSSEPLPGWMAQVGQGSSAAPTRPGFLVLPHEILRHRAVLTTPDGAPFSLVVESYTDALIVSAP